MLIRFENTIRVEPQALALWKRTLDYLEGAQQRELDSLTAKVEQLTGRLHQSNQALETGLPNPK